MTKKNLCFLVALAFAPAAFATYKCVDEKGVTRIGETPPDECANVMMYEISRSGQVLKQIPPSLTPAQIEANRANEAKRKEDAKKAFEQARLDEALLNTYASEREIDMTRDRNIEPINGRIKTTRDRIAAVDKRLKQIEDEMEFYKAGHSKTSKSSSKPRETPEGLLHDMERAKAEKVTLEKTIASSEKEIEALRNKYDNDKKRWLALKTTPQATPAKAPAK